jgi:hypothetical protein
VQSGIADDKNRLMRQSCEGAQVGRLGAHGGKLGVNAPPMMAKELE